MHSVIHRRIVRALPWAAAVFLFWLASTAFAQQSDPPGRAAHLSHREGGVVFAPQGEDEWVDLPQNRPLTTGDRLWTDRGARAELHLGTATMQLDGETHIGLGDIDERTVQLLLQQGAVQARVREITQGENFEIGTPNLALRALQPGEYRIDVAAADGATQVTVLSGLAAVFGQTGREIRLAAGQQAAFSGRDLAQVQPAPRGRDAFGAWAAERNRREDQSIAARHVPRGVVGYSQLDAQGTWAQHPQHGAIWYPRVTVPDWAPYRHGHWSWIQPWGWTWIDDAPWGFAPFHYGRWTMVADRWAWVPGRLAARPVYAPALVVFVGGGGSSASLDIGNGPAVGWYPLAPGEAWWPWYRTSPRYVNFANFNIDLGAYPRHFGNHVWRRRPWAVTAVRVDDFRRGRPVYRHWQPVQPHIIGRIPIGAAPARPEWRRGRDGDGRRRLHSAPPANVQPAVPSARWGVREWSGRQWDGGPVPPAIREQYRAQREQQRLQRDAERDAWRQRREAQEQPFGQPRHFSPRQQLQPQVQQQQPWPIRGGRDDRWERGREERWEGRREARGEGRGNGRGGGRGGERDDGGRRGGSPWR